MCTFNAEGDFVLERNFIPVVDIVPMHGRFCKQGKYCTLGGFLSPGRLQPQRNYLTRKYFTPRGDMAIEEILSSGKIRNPGKIKS